MRDKRVVASFLRPEIVGCLSDAVPGTHPGSCWHLTGNPPRNPPGIRKGTRKGHGRDPQRNFLSSCWNPEGIHKGPVNYKMDNISFEQNV